MPESRITGSIATRRLKRATNGHNIFGHNLAISVCNSLMGSYLYRGRGLDIPRTAGGRA
jgi:hypothetical protein